MTADFPPILPLVISGIAGLLPIPFGLPGLWVILFGILSYGWLTGFQTLSVWFAPQAVA